MIQSDMRSLLMRYRRSGVIVDSNLFLLYVVGTFEEPLISRFKRTRSYTANDYRLLHAFITRFESVLVTPNILTEVSNLSNQLQENVKESYFAHFGNHIGAAREHAVASDALRTRASFVNFGLTDASLDEYSSQGHLVLTDDLRLADYLSRREIDVVNFNHIRQWGV